MRVCVFFWAMPSFLVNEEYLEECADFVTKASDFRTRFVANNEVSANDIQGFGVIDAAL